MMSEWTDETLRRTGVDVRMGIKLYSAFLAARARRTDDSSACAYRRCEGTGEVQFEADLAVTLATAVHETGVATADELGADSLGDRIVQEMTANEGIIVARALIGAWTRLPE
jgi:hypothetical protein